VQRRLELSKEQYVQIENDLNESTRHHATECANLTKQKQTIQEALDNANKTVRSLQSRLANISMRLIYLFLYFYLRTLFEQV